MFRKRVYETKEGSFMSSEKESGEVVLHRRRRWTTFIKTPFKLIILAARTLLSALLSFLPFLWPSLAVQAMKGERKLRKTAYLDGMRGFAAFMVYWTHNVRWAHDTTSDGSIGHMIDDGFGHNGHYAFVALPFIRVMFSAGHYAVAMFFVISGYSLSLKPLTLIHAGDEARFLENLSAAVFKRALRLFIPLVATTYAYIISLWLFNIDGFPDREKTFAIEMWKLSIAIMEFTHLFPSLIQGGFKYNVFAWSIPTELRGSFIVFTALIALCKFRSNARLSINIILILYFLLAADGWPYSLFLSGMVLCELQLLAEVDSTPRFLLRYKANSKRIFYAMVIFSLYLGGMPVRNEEIKHLRSHWGWYYISFLRPTTMREYKWFYMFWAAVPMVAAVPHISWLKAFFETRFCQYLGEVSFGFYLVHGPVMWTIGNRLYVAVGFARDIHEKQLYAWLNEFPLPRSGPLGLSPAFLATQVVLLPVTLWFAEIITKVLDRPSVKLSQRLYNTILGPRTVTKS